MVGWLKKHQGSVSVAIATAIFWFGGNLIQAVDPTASRYDTGAIHGLMMGAVAFLTSGWLAWLILQLEWPTLNKHIDLNHWAQDWRAMRPEHRAWFILGVWSILFSGAVACLLGWR